MSFETLVWIIPLPPIISFFLITIFTRKNRGLSHWVALAAAGISWLASMVLFFRTATDMHLSEAPITSTINWLPLGETWLPIGIHIDPLSVVTLFFVAWTIFMIFIYSVGYHNFGQPEGDHDRPGLQPHGASVKDEAGHSHHVPSVEPMYSRFFAFISLFAFGMYVLVVTDNLLTLYMGWEIMGFCSYLLIGFWYGKKSARDAAVKAFLTTRVGDVFMLLGLVALYSLTNSLNYQNILMDAAVLEMLSSTSSPVLGLSWAGLIGILLFIGAVGKAAQFPLHVWLPDAMEGPTPVSAMIHAATMVSAGIYLVVRFFPLLSAGWSPGESLTSAMLVMAFIGSFTALFAATIALAQNDVKRVLAYSTISQLGYMVAALGVGAYTAAAFHLVTHAFFKALLFLGSGSIIHGMEHGVLHTGEKIDPQDMFNMGGLRKKMPITFWTFVAGGLALSGFPLVTAGFWSKDEILGGAYNGGQMLVFSALALAALFTAFYTMRQIALTFLGEPRTKSAAHAMENPPTMTVPLIVLSVFAITFGWIGVPKGFPLLGGLLPDWFQRYVGSMLHLEHGHHEAHSFVPIITSLVVALGGLLLGWLVYRNVKTGKKDPLQRKLGVIHKLLVNKYYIDEIYEVVFIRPSIWISETFSYYWIDQKILDGTLHIIIRFMLWLGKSLRNFIDIPVINGIGDGVSDGTRRFGVSLRIIQGGKVQQYMLVGMGIAVLAGIFLYYMLVIV